MGVYGSLAPRDKEDLRFDDKHVPSHAYCDGGDGINRSCGKGRNSCDTINKENQKWTQTVVTRLRIFCCAVAACANVKTVISKAETTEG